MVSTNTQSSGEYLLEMSGINKSFPGVKALDNVNLKVRPHSIHALMGENGAGKSTLLKCLFGIYQKDSGSILFQGKEIDFHSAKEALENMDLVDTPSSPQLPVGSLHWLIADETVSITVEAVKEGLMIYDNPAGVLTNNPPFPQQMFQLNNYMHLSPKQPVNTFSKDLPLNTYSRGMGALGLPGDLSSSSRFVRASYVKMNSRCNGDELSSVSQFFHILGSVDQQRGCCEVTEGKYEITLYTSCCNARKGIYYYTTYDNHQISAVDMHKTDLNGQELARFTPVTTEQIHFMN